jgi:hypothetical protein
MRWMNTLPEKFIEIDIFEPPTPLGTALHQDTCPYRNEVPQHHHHDLLSSRVDCRPPVLSNQYGCGCAKFGMKRPRTPEKYGHERNASRTRAPTSSCAAQGFRDGRRRLSRGFARQGQWTRYDSIRLPDRALAALVQSACNKPGSRQITHDHVRSGHGAWMAGPCRIPKLTVRVRFPSPAPNTNPVAAEPYSRIPISGEPVFQYSPGPLWATLIHTSALTLQLQKTLSLFRHVLRLRGSPVLPTSPRGVSPQVRAST